jgi:hypothetical protein
MLAPTKVTRGGFNLELVLAQATSSNPVNNPTPSLHPLRIVFMAAST